MLLRSLYFIVIFVFILCLNIILSQPTYPAQKIKITVDLSSQKLEADLGDGVIKIFSVSTGRTGFHTDVVIGYHSVKKLSERHISTIYDSPMPYAIFFAGGYAIHGSNASKMGYPASHGCVRLSLENARFLFKAVQKQGASIFITGNTEVFSQSFSSSNKTVFRRRSVKHNSVNLHGNFIRSKVLPSFYNPRQNSLEHESSVFYPRSVYVNP